MTIELQASAKKDLKKIDKQQALSILKQLKSLENFPHIANIKRLKNHYPPMRYRIGHYRVLFEVVEDTIIIVHIKHRKEAYK